MSWNTLGHSFAVELLARDRAQLRLRHAYLFTGPNGVGKRTLVHDFACALLCEAPEPPCGVCRACHLARKEIHPDLFTIAPSESGKRVRTAKIRIDPIRQLIYDLSLRPIESQRRVARLVRFDTANVEAANALLKTLEEPPNNVILLLTAERADDLLPTIVSRCEVIALRPMPLEVVRDALIARWLVPAERADLLAHLSGGRLGWAVRMHQDEGALEARAQRLDDLARLVSASRVERFAYAERLAREGSLEKIQDTLDLWLSFWRDVMLIAARATAPLANPDRVSELRRLAEAISTAQAQAVIVALRRSGELLERNVNTRLALEVLLLDWPRV